MSGERKNQRGNIEITEYYETLPNPTHPKTAFIEEIAKRTGKKVATVRLWVKGKTVPNETDRAIIAEIMNVPAESLIFRSEKIF